MNQLNTQERWRIVAALVEGASINSVVRMTGVSKPTILKLLVDLGTAYAKYQHEKLRNPPCKRIQCDEIWSFCYAKEKNLPEEPRGKSLQVKANNPATLHKLLCLEVKRFYGAFGGKSACC